MASLSQLATDLTTGNAEQRLDAAEQLSRLGENANPAAASLVQAVGDEAEEVREAVISTLEALETPPPSALPDFVKFLDSPNPDVAYWAATLLGRLGASGESAVSALAKTLSESPHASVRERAAWALGALGNVANTAIPALKAADPGDNSRLARLCRQSLGKITG